MTDEYYDIREWQDDDLGCHEVCSSVNDEDARLLREAVERNEDGGKL